jgi:Putative zinc-finger
MSISETELLAYVDGELDAADRARVEAAIETDELLARRVATQRGLRARLNASYNAVLDEAVPQRLTDVLNRRPADVTAGDATVTDIAIARAERDAQVARAAASTARRWSWREWSAVAASVTLGVLLGPAVLRQSQPLPFMEERGRVVAIGALNQELLQQVASDTTPDASSQVGVSFRAKDGRYCRSFSLRQGPAGLACRERGDWVVEVLARGAGRAGSDAGLRQAASAMPDVVRLAIEARIEGEPFDAAAEAQAIKKRWRNRPLMGPAP